MKEAVRMYVRLEMGGSHYRRRPEGPTFTNELFSPSSRCRPDSSPPRYSCRCRFTSLVRRFSNSVAEIPLEKLLPSFALLSLFRVLSFFSFSSSFFSSFFVCSSVSLHLAVELVTLTDREIERRCHTKENEHWERASLREEDGFVSVVFVLDAS